MRNFIFLVLISLFSTWTFGKSNLKFSNFSTRNGLSNSWVRCIHQDRLGFVWLGTDDGLNRFDGLAFQTFRPINEDQFEIGNFRVNKIIEKDSCHLWICTDSGLYIFDQAHETFKLDSLIPTHPVLSAVRDSLYFWFATNDGIYQYRLNPLQIKHLQKSDAIHSGPINNYVNTLLVDHNNQLWIGTKNGLSIYSTVSNNFVHLDKKPCNFSTFDILAIHEDPVGQIWIGTAKNGLYQIHTNKGEYLAEKMFQGNVTSIATVNQHEIWFGSTFGSGLGIINLDSLHTGTVAFASIDHIKLDKNALSDNDIFTIFANQMGDIWIGTFSQGLNYYNTHLLPFENVSSIPGNKNALSSNLVNAFAEDGDYLWIGTEEGLNRFHRPSGKNTIYKHNINDTTSLASNTVISLYKDFDGQLWVGNWAGGLNLYLPEKDFFKRFTPDGKAGSIKREHVFAITQDTIGMLWIGTNRGGLHRFNPKTSNFSQYIHQENNSYSLDGKSINDLLITQKNQLFISLYTTLDHYNYESNRFDHFHLNGDTEKNYTSGSISDLFEDKKGNLWLATNLGLELYNPANRSLSRYTTLDGLASNTIQSILEDDHGNLWMSTNKGISKFIDGTSLPDAPKFINFSEEDGIPAFDFKTRSSLKTKDGLFYFGSAKGYTYFHPDSILINTTKPRVVLTNFRIQESQPNATIKYKPYQGNINYLDRIELFYPNTDFTISFAAMNFLHPEKNTFKYKLDGYDTEWIDAGNNSYATYTNLQAGDYTFNVLGANNDGIWSTTPAILIIEVHPPWWKSTLFKIALILFILFVGAISIATRFIALKKEKRLLEAMVEKRTTELSRLNNLLEQKQFKIEEQNKSLELHQNQLEELVVSRTKELELSKRKAEESDKLKSSFLANMSHEIRTPLNAILGFSTMLDYPDLTYEKRRTYIHHIENNGKILSVLINDIIDISIIEANQLTLTEHRININNTLRELYNYYEIENDKRLTFVFANADEDLDLFLFNDGFRFRQVMVNLLSNAFKYTDKGEICFGYDKLESNVRFYVRDTGIGIPKNDNEKIFVHFFKSEKKKSKLYRGTGIGLAISKNLVEQMGGKIWVESIQNEGSTFYFTLPY